VDEPLCRGYVSLITHVTPMLISFPGIDEITAHVPDISTATGFLDLVLLGCVMEFSDALSRRHYLSGVPKDLVTQEHRAQWMF
jgi:hypothetical protein